VCVCVCVCVCVVTRARGQVLRLRPLAAVEFTWDGRGVHVEQL